MKKLSSSRYARVMIMISSMCLISYSTLASYPSTKGITGGEAVPLQISTPQQSTSARPLTLDAIPPFSTIRLASGRELVLERRADGVFYFDPKDPTVYGTLKPGDFAGIDLGGMKSLGAGIAQGHIRATNRLGGSSVIHLAIQQNGSRDFTATLTSPTGELVSEYQIWLGPEDTNDSMSEESLDGISAPAVLVFVITAAGIAALGCTLVALWTECTTECSRACRDEPGCHMISSSEGWCGTCTCACQCDDGNPGFEPIW